LREHVWREASFALVVDMAGISILWRRLNLATVEYLISPCFVSLGVRAGAPNPIPFRKTGGKVGLARRLPPFLAGLQSAFSWAAAT